MAVMMVEARAVNGDVAEDRPISNSPPPLTAQLSITARTASAFDTKRLTLRRYNLLLDAQKNSFAFLYGQANVTSSIEAFGKCADPIRVRGGLAQ